MLRTRKRTQIKTIITKTSKSESKKAKGKSDKPLSTLPHSLKAVATPMTSAICPRSFADFKASTLSSGSGASESLSVLTWKATFFEKYDSTSSFLPMDLLFDPTSVINLPGSDVTPIDYGVSIDHISVWVLPEFITDAGAITSKTALGMLTGVPMRMSSADSTLDVTKADVSGTQVVTEVKTVDTSDHQLLGAESHRLTTQSTPTWVKVLSFDMRGARSRGMTPSILTFSGQEIWCVAQVFLCDLFDGIGVTGEDYTIQCTLTGRTALPPLATTRHGLATTKGVWGDPQETETGTLNETATVVDVKSVTSSL